MSRETTSTQIRADAVLTSAYVAATDYPVPLDCERVTLHLSYTRNAGSTTGYPTIKIQWKTAVPLTLDGNKISGDSLVVPEEWPIGPSAATIKTAIPIVVPDGVTLLSVSIKETGDTTNLGDALLRAAKGERS